MQRSTEADEQPPSALQDLLNDVQVITNTVGAPLAALAGTTKVFAQGVASQVRLRRITLVRFRRLLFPCRSLEQPSAQASHLLHASQSVR